MRAILFTYFQSGTTKQAAADEGNINSYDYEITIDMLDQITDLRVTDGKIEDILNAEKGNRVARDIPVLSLPGLDKQNFQVRTGSSPSL